MTGINGVEKRSLADITENTFIGTTAVKGRNGTLTLRYADGSVEVDVTPRTMINDIRSPM